MNQTNNGFKIRLKQFLLSYLMVTCLAAIIGWPLYDAYSSSRQEAILERETSFIRLSQHLFTKEFQERIGDIRMLGSLPSLRRVLETNNPVAQGELKQLLQNFSDAYRGYDQVRLIDREGMETIRINLVNGRAKAAPPADLQDKSSRPYFKQTMKLAEGEVYISPMDLNIEHDRIEEPYKPVIRFATPVFARDGTRLGVVALNYLAAEMLGKFRETMARDLSHQGMLINPEGYWLSNHDRSNEWGFMLGRTDLVFGSLYPEAWAHIQSTEQGQIFTEQGLFVFESFSPLAFDNVSLPNTVPATTLGISQRLADDYRWTIVIFLPAEALASTALFNQPLVRGMLCATAILLAAADNPQCPTPPGGIAPAGTAKKPQRPLRERALWLPDAQWTGQDHPDKCHHAGLVWLHPGRDHRQGVSPPDFKGRPCADQAANSPGIRYRHHRG